MSEIGAKHDQGKLLFSCFTQGLAPVIKGVVVVLTYGAQKYKRDSWQQVPNAKERYMDAFERHMHAYNCEEGIDPESGIAHIFHAICNLMFVAWFDIKSHPFLVNGKFNEPPKL